MQWKIDHNAEVAGTSLQATINTSYSKLLEILGPPMAESDGYKVSTEWVFKNGDFVATLYDYKETSLYDENLPSTEEFRKQPAYEWHIGAKTQRIAYDFKIWLMNKLMNTEL